MKNSKNKKFFIISIIILVLILIGGFTYAMLATNLLKSNKELFFKYAMQILGKENSFIDNKIEQYNEKKKGTIYENEGTFSVNINSQNLDTQALNDLNNLTISFAGNIDNPNSKVEELVNINYSESVKFPILYKKVNGVHGIKLSEISKRYFAIKQDTIENLFSILSGSSSIESNKANDIESSSSNSTTQQNAFDWSSIKLTQEEKDRLMTTYLSIIEDNLETSSFTKVSTTGAEGYTLEITNQKFKEIYIKLLETLKEDTTILNKLSQISDEETIKQSIEELISKEQQTEASDGKSIITIFQSNNKLNKIEIQYNDEFKVTISKTSSEDEVIYNIVFENQSDSVNLKLSYLGLQNLEEITENYELSINSGNTGESYSYKVDNKVKFLSNTEINDFEENEYIDLFSLDSETRTKLLESIVKGIESSNNEELQEAGIQGENPIINIVPGLSDVFGLLIPTVDLSQNMSNLTINNETGVNEDDSETKNNDIENSKTENDATESNTTESNTTESSATESNATENNATESNATENNGTENNGTDTDNNNTQANTTNNTENTNTSSSSSFVEGMEQVTKESFNEKFKQYEGDNVKGNTVKSLIMQIIANNMLDDGRNISVTGDIKLTGDEVPDSIQNSGYYKVKCYTDKEGYVNKVNITEKK